MRLVSITERAVVFITTWGGVYVCRLHALAYSTSMSPTHLSSFSPHLQRHLLRIPVEVRGQGKECVAVSKLRHGIRDSNVGQAGLGGISQIQDTKAAKVSSWPQV